MPKPKPSSEDDEDFYDEEDDGGSREPRQTICSFCGRSQAECNKLIAGPAVYICNYCIELCNDIMVEESVEPLVKAGFDKPDAELKALLDNAIKSLKALAERCDTDEIEFSQARSLLSVLLSLQDAPSNN